MTQQTPVTNPLISGTYSDLPAIIPADADFNSASGAVRFRMTNDYLFRAVFQSNTKALTGLLCSLLHLKPQKVNSVTITNPIELGKSLDDKTFILDIAVLLNDTTVINLEMQIVNLQHWPERSLSYLCRSFDHLSKGLDYLKIKPVIQVCFLDFTLFRKYPEFYATYRMLNIKNHNVYSDKFTLSVVDLTQIKAATEEDKANHLDYWAALFKATEWEEIKMLARNNEYIKEASQSMYQLSAEEKIRQQCEAREENERIQRSMERAVSEAREEVERLQRSMEKAEERANAAEAELFRLRRELAALKQEEN